jgi:TatD DNase family protein
MSKADMTPPSAKDISRPMSAYVDTHCHLDSIIKKLPAASFAAFAEAHLTRDCEACLTVSCDPHAIEPTLALLQEAEQARAASGGSGSVVPRVYAAFGIHPHDSKHWNEEIEARLVSAIAHPLGVAYGEIGLDYHYDFSDRPVQREVFAHQLRLGVSLGKPLVIHTREAEDDTLALLTEHVPADYPMHVHCFTSSLRMADNLFTRFSRVYLGFTGIVTFKNAGELEAVAKATPKNRFLLETDGPYLAPMPHRGKVAHPGHIPLIAAKLGEWLNMPLAEVFVTARQNTRDIYGI